MCPLLASPNRGYPDWQRISNYDTGTLWSIPTAQRNSQLVGPTLDVSRFAYLGGFIGTTQGDAQLTLQWTEDAAATVGIASRIFWLSSNITNFAQIRIPNLGPFCQPSIQPLAGLPFTPAGLFFATNRVAPTEMIPHQPLAIDAQGVFLSAGVNGTFYSTDYYSGPVYWAVNMSGTSFELEFEALTSDDQWDPFFWAVPGVQVASGIAVFPPSAVRAFLANTGGGAIQVSLTVIPSMSGAS